MRSTSPIGTTTDDAATLLGNTTASVGSERSVQAVAAASQAKAVQAEAQTQDLYDKAVAGSLDPLSSSQGAWSTFGSAAGRFGPWAALLGLAFVAEGVARSALRDRLRMKTVKRS